MLSTDLWPSFAMLNLSTICKHTSCLPTGSVRIVWNYGNVCNVAVRSLCWLWMLRSKLDSECLNQLTSNSAIDAGTMGQWKADFKNTLLGSRYGRLATITSHPSAEVVLACQWPGCAEWDWPCYAYTQHAHHNVWIFSQQVNTNFQRRWLTFLCRCRNATSILKLFLEPE